MEDITKIYSNSIGISFHWKNTSEKNTKKIQVVFKDTGLFLTVVEIRNFSYLINEAITRTKACGNCPYNSSCKSILLETPIKQVNLAVNYTELMNIEELIKGTIFNIELNSILIQNTILKNNK